MTKLDFIKSVYFDEHTYRAAKAESLNAQGIDGGGWDGYSVARAFENAGMTAWEHYTSFGAFELDAEGDLGINPSSLFDQNAYYETKVEQLQSLNVSLSKEQVADAFREVGFSPISHYATVGFAEWVIPTLENIPHFASQYPYMSTNFSGDYRIDALVITDEESISCNTIGAKQGNVLYYTFPTDPKGQINSAEVDPLVNVAAFNDLQKEGVLTALGMHSAVSGIRFEYTDNVDQANLLFFSGNEAGPAEGTMAYSQWIDDTRNAVVVNTTEFPELNDLRFGGHQEGLMTLLHEIGHALGLKHPFSAEGGTYTLPDAEENYAYTLMSYTDPGKFPGGEHAWYSATNSDNYFSPYDIAALQWIYGTDGLNGYEGQVYTGA